MASSSSVVRLTCLVVVFAACLSSAQFFDFSPNTFFNNFFPGDLFDEDFTPIVSSPPHHPPRHGPPRRPPPTNVCNPPRRNPPRRSPPRRSPPRRSPPRQSPPRRSPPRRSPPRRSPPRRSPPRRSPPRRNPPRRSPPRRPPPQSPTVRHPLGLPAPTNPGVTADLSRCRLARTPRSCDENSPYRTFDGSCNNLARPAQGQANRLHARLLTPDLDQGKMRRLAKSGRELPSARKISTKIFELAHERDLSRKFSNMLWVWGQFIDHDLTISPAVTKRDCCARTNDPECIPITVDKSDPIWGAAGRKCINVRRSKAVEQGQCGQRYREQINELTSYIDGSQVYGSSKSRADELRSKRKGQLKMDSGNILPTARSGTDCELPDSERDRRCFASGESRSGENMGLTSLHVVFVRYHNQIADILYNKYRSQNKYNSEQQYDEAVFQETRRIVIAIIQAVTYREYLPIILGRFTMNHLDLNLNQYSTYQPGVDATIVNAFAAAAFRIGHSQVSEGFHPMSKQFTPVVKFIDLVDTINIQSTFRNTGQENTIRAVIKQPSQSTVNHKFTENLRDRLDEKASKDNLGLDLPAINIQRARDHGVPAYNKWRKLCGLPAMSSLSNMPDHPTLVSKRMETVYEHPDDIDLYAGAVTESPVTSDAQVGPTFACILADQFWRLKNGDRFWFESQNSYPNPFTNNQLAQIRQVSLAKVICDTLEKGSRVPADAFRHHSALRTCDQLSGIDFGFW